MDNRFFVDVRYSISDFKKSSKSIAHRLNEELLA